MLKQSNKVAKKTIWIYTSYKFYQIPPSWSNLSNQTHIDLSNHPLDDTNCDGQMNAIRELINIQWLQLIGISLSHHIHLHRSDQPLLNLSTADFDHVYNVTTIYWRSLMCRVCGMFSNAAHTMCRHSSEYRRTSSDLVVLHKIIIGNELALNTDFTITVGDYRRQIYNSSSHYNYIFFLLNMHCIYGYSLLTLELYYSTKI